MADRDDEEFARRRVASPRTAGGGGALAGGGEPCVARDSWTPRSRNDRDARTVGRVEKAVARRGVGPKRAHPVVRFRCWSRFVRSCAAMLRAISCGWFEPNGRPT